MIRLLLLILLLADFSHAGTVKTFDNKKMEKDSTAELKLFSRSGNAADAFVLLAFISSIDTVRIYDKYLEGEDIFAEMSDERDALYYQILSDFDMARRIKRVFLESREYQLTLQGILDFNRKLQKEFTFAAPIVLKFTPLPGQSCEIGTRTDGTKSEYWIEDRKTKEVVSTFETTQ